MTIVDPLVWHLVFLGARTHRSVTWWESLLIDKRYTHVIALGYASGRWLLVDARRSGLDLAAIPGAPDSYPAGIIEMATDIIPVVPVRLEAGGRRHIIGIGSCVGTMKHLLGAVAPLVWTPRQLHRWARRHALRVPAREPEAEAAAAVPAAAGEADR